MFIDGEGKYRLCVKIQCENQECLKWFWKPKRFLGRSVSNYCCRQCSLNARHLAKSTSLLCCLCGKEFREKNSKLANKSGFHFCCREHKDIGQRIENGLTQMWPDHYGSDTGGNYRDIALRNYPNKCNRCGYDKIKSVLEIHHKDRDRSNRKVDNLEILCPTCHQEEHFIAGDGRFHPGRNFHNLMGT